METASTRLDPMISAHFLFKSFFTPVKNTIKKTIAKGRQEKYRPFGAKELNDQQICRNTIKKKWSKQKI